MTSILFGGRAAIEAAPALVSLINCNSPLRWDEPPPLDDAIRAELDEYVTRRRRELGD